MIGLRGLLLVAALVVPTSAAAQPKDFVVDRDPRSGPGTSQDPQSGPGTPRDPRVHRLEVTGGVGYFSGATLGHADASLRTNALMAQTFTVFTTDTALSGSITGEARVGLWLSRRIGVEGRLGYSRPDIKTSVSADAEGAAPITVAERIDQFVIDAGILVRLDEMRVGGLVPFAAGGAGYLRQLHEGFALIEQGHVYHLGGGVTRDVVSRTQGVIRAAGLRADARVYFLSGGASLDDRATVHGSFTGGLFIRF